MKLCWWLISKLFDNLSNFVWSRYRRIADTKVEHLIFANFRLTL